MVDKSLTKLPVRLVQENGNVINLDVTNYNFVIYRNHSQIPIPLRAGQNVGIDINMPQIAIGLSGVLTDDAATNDAGAGAVGEVDFGYYSVSAGTNNIISYLPITWGCGAPDKWIPRNQWSNPKNEFGQTLYPYITRT